MLGPILWNLDALIAHIHHLLIHTPDLMTKHKGIFLIGPKVPTSSS